MATVTTSDVSEESYSEADRAKIHEVASRLVDVAVTGGAVDPRQLLGELAMRPVAGVYVTLKRGETLRGCCGLQGNPMPLSDALAHSAERTAKHDPRMPAIDPAELPFLNLTVSILGSPRPIGVTGDDRIAAVNIGNHGLRIRMGNQVGLLLPSVARERNWNSRQFLDAVCRKAGLPPGAWRSDQAVVEIFDGIDFGGPLSGQDVNVPEERAAVEPDQMEKLTAWVRDNLSALIAGATPCYYASGVVDTSVLGVVLQVTYDAAAPPVSWLQMVFRDGVPLQSTLFQLTQAAAETLAPRGPHQNLQVRVAVLTSAIQHGLDTDADLRGLHPGRRAIVARDARRVSVCFDRDADPADLLKQALAAQPFRSGSTEVYSMVCDCVDATLAVSIGPQAVSGITTRPPGVAGTFYPAADVDREAVVDELLRGLPKVKQKRVAAAMVPHAGLRYSGRIAADVWRRIALPESVLIIGPKHTADGVDWAVAPHDVWQLSSTASLPGAVELAEQLAAAVPGMELDAAAHRREHGIEVQLPILYRLSPQTRVAAVAMSGGSLDELTAAAGSLATWLQGLDQPPLLIISSDMNHFADDAENRRRDRLALAMLEKNDPAGLLSVCAEENISMCGQLPAALVLLTLKKLGQKVAYEQIAYGTSADVTGDTSRVVGYAGVLF
jgi:AmmeMemoRadiSam system protein B/AmmeMemoRadiSam system protein A